MALEAGSGGVGKHAESTEKVFKSITAKLGDWKSKHKKPEAGQSSSSNVAAFGLAGKLEHAPLCDSEHLVPFAVSDELINHNEMVLSVNLFLSNSFHIDIPDEQAAGHA